MLTLYHAPQSRSSRILWLLEELGADYEIAYVDIVHADGSGGPDAKNPHPDKKVPALVHDGTLITESIAIALYLTDMCPDAGIAPKVSNPERGAYLTWLAYYAGVMEPVLNLQFFDLDEHDGLAHTFRSRKEMDERILASLNATTYIAGENFSAADIMIASLGHFIREMLPASDVVDAYLERCSDRPALAAANAKEVPPA
ncbi:MAG: glutathione S-transferase [Hyphomicrobiaceae bacterium]|nr:glutathione S-transferase [Hyphomicrobiaceae bacterium]